MKLFYNQKNEVTLIYYAELPSELESLNHIEVEELPQIEDNGKEATLMCDGNKCWYEYKEKEISETDKLKQRITDLEIAISAQLGSE